MYLIMINGQKSIYHSGFASLSEVMKEIERLENLRDKWNEEVDRITSSQAYVHQRGDAFRYQKRNDVYSIKEVQ